MRLENGVWKFSTSSSSLFKRCRRKWLYATRMGFTTPQNEWQWMGSCFHHVLEDLHGIKKYKTLGEAIATYTDQCDENSLPVELEKCTEKVIGMYETYISYLYEYFHPDKYKTLIVDGEPQVEVKFTLNLGIKDSEGHPVHFNGIIDRIVEDEQGDIWLVDYKTKGQGKIDTTLLNLDPQIGSYLWATPHWFGRQPRGIIYIQIVRAVPDFPTVGKRGDVSVAKTQLTTASLYRSTLEEVYGSVEEAPDKQQLFLQDLILEEGVTGNRFIRVDRVTRNPEQNYSTHVRLVNEAQDMLDALGRNALYYNPTRDCNWDCPFMVPCLLAEEGRDTVDYLEANFVRREDADEELVA